MDSSRQLKVGAIMSYGVLAINMIIGLLYTPWMIHSIGKENYGLYSLAMSVISLFVFDFGLSVAVTRFLSKYLAEGRQDKANNCLGLVFRLYLLLDIVILTVLTGIYFFLPSIYQKLTPEELEKFKIVYGIVAIYSVFSFPFIPLNGILTAHEKFVQLKIAEFAHKVVIVVSMSACLLLGYGLYALVLVNAFAGVTMILLKLFFIKKYTPQGVNIHFFNKGDFVQLIGFSGWITVCSIAQRFIFNIAPSILAALSGAYSVAILSIATGLEAYSYTFSSALSGLLLPKVSQTIHKDPNELLPLMVKVGRIQLYVVGLIFTGFVFLGSDFILLWVGEDFRDSYICTLLIILPSIFYVPMEIGTQAIMVMNKVRAQAFIYIGMAVVNILLSLFLVKQFGAIGMCVSICIAYLLRTIGIGILFYKEMSIDVWQFVKKTYSRYIVPLIVVIAWGLSINFLLKDITWISFGVKGSLFVVGYCLLIYFCAFDQYEKGMVKSLIKK